MRILCTFSIFILLCSQVFSDSGVIASFNAKHLGWGKKDYSRLAEILSLFDIVGLEEVMNRGGVEALERELESLTGEEWDYRISYTKVGDYKYSEYFAYIWKKDKVKFLNNRGFYPDNDGAFFRPPYACDFKIGEFDFTFILAHIIFGDKKSQRQAEALSLPLVYDYFQKLNGNEQDILIAGDFNLPAYDDSFKNLFSHQDSIFYAVNPANKTTIGKSGLASSYDNIFYSFKYTSEYTGRSGVLDFTNSDYKLSREKISDHLPVFIEVDTSYDDD